ncbi:unnamed protein product [Orchesella dallaii]|uniref:Condensin complex subunit 2 n=1 Tax=Orchesella dallaii TaxID=48710 RepID=A0ABP1PQ22_9HEXA
MSSSEDESEIFETSPVEAVMRVSARRKANTPVPPKVPLKKPRDARALADFNMPDDSDEEEVPVKRSKNVRNGTVSGPVQQGKRKKAVLSNDSSLDEESSGSDGGSKSEVENRPPTSSSSAVSNVDIPEDNSQPVAHGEINGQSGRTRKRLSIRSADSASGTDRGSMTSGVTSGADSITGSEVQTIYETCSQMFNTNRINAQNAFNLRLLDCINVMINSPTYDKSNMQLTSSTVEIGTKIYVCRVDNAHSQVLSLASEISLQKRHKKKEGQEQGDVEDEQPQEGHGDADIDDDEVPGRRQKQKKKKRGKFVEEDNSKLLTGLEEQNVKFVTRRNVLKKKFNEMVFEDLDFDYLSHFLEPEEEHPMQTAKEAENMESALRISESYMNPMDMGRLHYLPFRQLQKFDPETYDIWGQPLNEAEGMREAEILQDPLVPVDADFAYNPEDRPAEYPEEPEPNYLNDTFGDGPLNENAGNDDNGIMPVSFKDIPDLDCLDEYFQRVKGLIKESRSKFGWCGPNFVRPKNTWAVKQGPKKPKVRKEPECIDFCKIDWAEQNRRFNVSSNAAARTVYDDKIIESWSAAKVIIPFLGIELSTYEDDFDPADFENENDPKYVPPIFKLFTNRNRSILDLLTTRAQGNAGSHYGDDGFDHENYIELPRDMQEDFCSQPENEHDDQFPQRDCNAANESGWAALGSVPQSQSLQNEDPLSLVSGIDSIKFSRKPKPIDMSGLKKAILKSLTRDLGLDENGQPLEETETRISMEQLMIHVLKIIDDKTETLLSISIFIVALMHVVAEKRLFVFYDDSDVECPQVYCPQAQSATTSNNKLLIHE